MNKNKDVANVAPPKRKRGYQPGRAFESPEQKKVRIDKENAEWAAKSGPVTVRYRDEKLK